MIIGFLTASVVVLLLKFLSNNKKQTKQLERSLQEIFPQLLNNASQQLITLADQHLKTQTQDIKTDVQNKKQIIEEIVKKLHEDLEKNRQKLEESERERIGTFSQLKTEIENQRKLTEQLSTTAEGLKKVLAHNQLRGQFGEQIAEDLLRMCGFVSGLDYVYNKQLSESETRPDFTVLLPDGMKINIDVKFPYINLQKMVEADDVNIKNEYKKTFEKDVREKIKQVSNREYINLEDNTVDFVILFIPNEMIFSFIYEKMQSIWLEAMRQKVILAGPFNFTATLRLIRQSYANFTIQTNIKSVIQNIKLFETEFIKYNEEFEKIGDKINILTDQYNKVNITRTKKLINTIEKISDESIVNLAPLESVVSKQ